MNGSPSSSPSATATVVVLCCALLGALGCSKDRASAASGPAHAEAKHTLRYQGSAGLVTYPELAEALGYLAPVQLVHVGNTISGPQDIQSVVTGDTDFGGAFNGAIVKLLLSKAPIRAVIGLPGVDEETWYGFYVLDDAKIRSARDFIGKKVAMNTLGAHHEFVLKEYLQRGGLTKAEVEQVTLVVLPPVNTEQALRARQIDVAVLGSVVRDKALERGGIHPVFSDYELFGQMTSASYVVHERLAREHPETVRKFVEATGKAMTWVRERPREEVVARMEQIIAQRGRSENSALLRYFRPVRGELPGGLLSDLQFQRWIDWMVRDGQLQNGQLKASELYTNQFNPLSRPAVKRPHGGP